MLVIIAILLIFGAVVRHKWRNAAAKKEEILRLVAMTSEEEAEIAKLLAVEGYSAPSPPPPPPPPQLEKQFYCAVCYCPTTTRCARCKAVRYCSGKCQIVHWRQGHKDVCQPVSSLHASKENEFVEEAALDNGVEMHFGRAKIASDPEQEVDGSRSSSSSLPCFSNTSPEHSETSFDASTSEVHDSATPIWPRKAPSEFIDSHESQRVSDSDKADVPVEPPLNPTFHVANNAHKANKIKKTLATKFELGFPLTSSKDRKTSDRAAVIEDFVPCTAGLGSFQSSNSQKTPLSTENIKNQAESSSGKVKKSTYLRGSVKHQELPNIDLRNSRYEKSLNTLSLDEYWKGEACTGKETRSTSVKSLGNDQNVCTRTGSPRALLSEVEVVQVLSQPSSNGLKTSVRKFVQHFRVLKQSKPPFDMGKDSVGIYNHKIIFPPKLFMQLYSSDVVKLHPFGLANIGNSCYANAVLQCLTFTRPITSYLLQGLHSRTCRKREWCLICEFERLICKGQETNFALSPIGILSQIQRIGSHLSHRREEDAHDFLRNMVDTMQSIWLEEAGVSGSLGEDSTLLGLTFGGSLLSKIKCLKCSGRSEQCDRMMDLSVEIDGDINTLEESLAKFTTSETLGGDDKYKCSRCKSYQKAKKRLTVVEAPNCLTIALKRFRSGNSEKLNKPIHFPEILNLAPYMSGIDDRYPIYHLYAVVVHLNMMNASYNGHYISYVKNYRDEWYRVDDSRVSRVDLETVLSVEAYILFYARHSPRIPSLIMNNCVHSDEKSKRNMEAISASSSSKKKNSKSKPCSFDRHTEPRLKHEQSQRHSNSTPPNDFTGNHMSYPDDWGFHPNHRNHTVESSSDSSSIFSTSDAGSYSTDSTKDSSAEDISGYIFGSSMYTS